MVVEWFYAHKSRIYGPLSLSDLQAALLLGFVRPSDLICKREINGWKKAEDLPELRGWFTEVSLQAEGNAMDRSKREHP
jgi:hypothetical protein